MKLKIITSFLILSVILVPQVDAQTESIAEVDHVGVEITIDSERNVVVIHQIKYSNESRQLKFVEGTVSNLELIDKLGERELVNITKETDSIIIMPDQNIVFVKYNLDDVVILKNNIWALDFRYLETTTFVLPEEIELLFINERPVFLEGKKSFRCHGCEMILEYSIDKPSNFEYVNWENREFVIEIITFTNIEEFEFDQPSKQISFKVNDGNQFVTTVIPLELLWNPYTVFLDDKKIYFNEYINNGTHVWVNIKPDTSGEVVIIGTTVVPEFPIIAPLAIGFLMIMILPLVRKFNLH